MPIGLGSIISGAQGGGLIGSLFPPLGRAWVQGQNVVAPNELIDIGSAIACRYRGVIDEGSFKWILRAHGFTGDNADKMFRVGEQLLAGVELISLERRGKLGELDIEEEAFKSGITPTTLDNLRDLTLVIPSGSDIISFAVREVYSPEIAIPFGQFEGLDEVVEKAADDLKAIGMTKEQFAKYWAAHWMLPSIGQGFEMLHRGEIPAISTEARPLGLDRLMKALDVMPAWQKPLTAISYAPYTRVDVRRMHKIGVLDDEEVFTAYADVGFSPFALDCVHETVAEAFACEKCRTESKAGRMLGFTILYNFSPPEVETTAEDTERAKQKDLTKADVLNGYRDGLLEEEEATEVLYRLGYSKEEQDFYIAKTDYQREQAEVNDTTKYLHDAYVKGIITFEEVTDELGKVNLPAKMTDYYLKVWLLERNSRILKPTKAELGAFLRKKIIDKETWHEEMVGIGYPDKYIKWYAEAI